ncbi:hypothetical protein DVK85_12965 [Flavobacterium arcticum]|uniref:YtxH domain-containing protein n=1 Tax=Flavobacterium arcticum TaxID=1784713 RepID=A0A345HET0_9FLAO|nr:hypothetical protein [Flavobacterium arcticum]AXG75090.1 hypothetical protein DVK85_12965 [Flavobacterium arcticum]KAF2511131.1 hypothetical protein E0W72_06980 [Flavobacterium arcticum]
MSNRALIAGIAAGAAALATAAIFISRRNAKKTAFRKHVEEAKDNLEGKLNTLHKKAEKEVKNADKTINVAKERANEWTKTANA